MAAQGFSSQRPIKASLIFSRSAAKSEAAGTQATGQRVGGGPGRVQAWGADGGSAPVADLERELSEHLVVRLIGAVAAIENMARQGD